MPLKARDFYETMYLHNQVTQTFLIFADAGPMARAATQQASKGSSAIKIFVNGFLKVYQHFSIHSFTLFVRST